MVAKIGRNKREKKKSLKNLVFYAFFAVIAFGIVVLLAYTNFKIYQRRSELNIRITELKKELSELESKNEDLEENINYAESQDYLEKAAREQLDLKKPGEEVVVIQREEAKKEDEEKDKNWWEKLKSIFVK